MTTKRLITEKQRAMLALLRRGEQTTAALAAATGQSRSAVQYMLDDLVKIGAAYRAGTLSERPGRPHVLYAAAIEATPETQAVLSRIRTLTPSPFAPMIAQMRAEAAPQ